MTSEDRHGFVCARWVVGDDVAVRADGEAVVVVDDGCGLVDVDVAFEVADGDGAGHGERVYRLVEVGVFDDGGACESFDEFVADGVDHRVLLVSQVVVRALASNQGGIPLARRPRVTCPSGHASREHFPQHV